MNKSQVSSFKCHGRWAIVGAIVLALAPTASAQVAKPETLELTLADAVQRAVEHNPDLAIVRLGTEADAARVSQSRSLYSPLFSTTLGGSKNATPPSRSEERRVGKEGRAVRARQH